MLHLVGIEDGDRVAVGDLNYSAFNDTGNSNRWEEKKGEGK
jgi:hypothetical protein